MCVFIYIYIFFFFFFFFGGDGATDITNKMFRSQGPCYIEFPLYIICTSTSHESMSLTRGVNTMRFNNPSFTLLKEKLPQAFCRLGEWKMILETYHQKFGQIGIIQSKAMIFQNFNFLYAISGGTLTLQ